MYIYILSIRYRMGNFLCKVRARYASVFVLGSATKSICSWSICEPSESFRFWQGTSLTVTTITTTSISTTSLTSTLVATRELSATYTDTAGTAGMLEGNLSEAFLLSPFGQKNNGPMHFEHLIDFAARCLFVRLDPWDSSGQCCKHKGTLWGGERGCVWGVFGRSVRGGPRHIGHRNVNQCDYQYCNSGSPRLSVIGTPHLQRSLFICVRILTQGADPKIHSSGHIQCGENWFCP